MAGTEDEVRVACLGDGTFGHMKGYAPVPKKRLAKILATKGLTIMLDEFYTSRQCPCGISNYKTIQTFKTMQTVAPAVTKQSGSMDRVVWNALLEKKRWIGMCWQLSTFYSALLQR